MNIVIIGAGIAGLTAAETIRKNNPSYNVVLFSNERQSPYYRPRLPEVVSGKTSPDKLYVHPDTWFKELNLEFRKGENVVEICLDNNQVRGSLGSRLLFDRILLATGAQPFLPDVVKKFQLPGIYPLRTLNDAVDLNYKAKKAKKALQLGSGLLGLELGNALTTLGLEVHVLELSDRILPYQTTPKSSLKLQGMLEKKGFVFHLKSEAMEAQGKERLERVLLKSGEVIDVDLMAVSTGITPNLSLATALELKIEKGIVVDQYMETTKPGIYAAGDCAQTPDRHGGLWSIARLEALTAGFNLAQDDISQRKAYEPAPPSNLLKVAGIDLIASGDIDPEEKLPFAEYETPESYRKVVVNLSGVLVGFTNLGTTKGNKELGLALGKKTIPQDILEDLKRPDFDFKRLESL